jgi:signal transduction histidine kinase
MELTNRINGMLDHIEETFKRQENFVADASHELKTPISVIAGYINMLKRWGAKDESILAEGIDAISRESENMRRMVEQLLLLARIGKINMHVTRFDADEALRDTVEGYRLSNEKHHTIVYETVGEVLVDTDKSLLVELVRILVNNAVKYTPEGGTVTVSVWIDANALKISVADTGVGIPAEDLPQLYDRFFRCDKVRGRESGGTGLGLTIAKSIADTLGGKIEVVSELGKGTTFTVTLY